MTVNEVYLNMEEIDRIIRLMIDQTADENDCYKISQREWNNICELLIEVSKFYGRMEVVYRGEVINNG